MTWNKQHWKHRLLKIEPEITMYAWKVQKREEEKNKREGKNNLAVEILISKAFTMYESVTAHNWLWYSEFKDISKVHACLEVCIP